MNPRLRSLLAAALFLAAAPYAAAARELSEAEAQMVLDCINNTDPAKGQLSPAKADECVDQFNEGGGELTEKASKDFPTLAVQAVARNNALSDLRDIIVKYEGRPMALALQRVLTERDVLKQMNLGPRAESLNDWVGKHLSGRQAVFKKSIRSWDTLGEIRTKGLTADGHSEGGWASVLPADRDNGSPDRYKTLYFWARKKADELLASSGVAAKNKELAAEYGPLVAVLKEDLEVFGDPARIPKLDKLMKDLGAAAEAKPAGPSAADKKSKDVLDAANRLKGATAGGNADSFLARTFDNARDSGGADGVGLGGGKFTPVPITDAQAAQLGPRMGEVKGGKMTGALADEMRGTRAGDEIIGFFEDPAQTKAGGNALQLKFEKGTGNMEDALGWYSSRDKVTRINTSLVDKFCEDRRITPEQLLKDDKAMRDLATYIAPTFVHETAHQRQDAWNTARGYNFLQGRTSKFSPYQMEMEAEAFGMNGAFVAEKTQKIGPGYLQKIDRIDRADAERYLEDGVDGLRKQYHGESYTQIDSIKGEAARQIDDAASTAARVNELSRKSQQKDVEMTAAEREELREGREALRTRFRWYGDTLAKSKEDERKMLGWRDDIDPEGKVLSSVKASLLPEPGGE